VKADRNWLGPGAGWFLKPSIYLAYEVRNLPLARYKRIEEVTHMQVEDRPIVETVAATGSNVLETVKNLVHEGNIRRIVIKHEDKTIAEFPLTFGVVGAAFAPALAAIGAITALMTDCTIEVEHATPTSVP
jgi:uncharacterized protein DUF4342